MTTEIIKDLQALFKKGHIGWTASGYGKMAEGTGGNTMLLLVKSTKYNEGNNKEEDEGERIIKHCDNNRSKFCDSDLGIT